MPSPSYPYSSIVRIVAGIGGSYFQGSGVLIAPDEVLTASHLLYTQGVGTATSVVVSLGYLGQAVRGVSYHYNQINDADGLLSNQQSQFDYAVIHLASPLTSAGVMGLQANFPGGAVHVSGYPGSAYGEQVTSTQLAVRDPRYTLLDTSTIGLGSSGGPVWIETETGPYVVGTISSQSLFSSAGYDALITSGAYNQIQGWLAADAAQYPPQTLIHSLTQAQQTELIYIGYYNRAADGGGFAFWAGQNLWAQNGGQSADDALKNIANSFTPQAETSALYPFLGSGADLTSPASQASLSGLLDNVYGNLFGRAADAGGKAYWAGAISRGTVSLGTSVLAIANGASGTDATLLQNKVTVALDFTTRTAAAGLGGIPTPSFVNAAKAVLTGIDGASLNDASVTAAEAKTLAYINNPAATIAAAPIAADLFDSSLDAAARLQFDPQAPAPADLAVEGWSGQTYAAATTVTAALPYDVLLPSTFLG